MRAVVHHEFGDPAQVLTIEDVATPEPGPGEVRIRLSMSAVHNHDLLTVAGVYGFKPELPARAGTEAVGVVEAVGDGVDHLAPGQRVVTGGTFGVWAEQFIAKAATVVPVPDTLPDEAAAQLVAMPLSALSLLDSLDLREGDWMIQNAANGAVGRLVAQLAAARGINVVGLVRRSAGVDELSSQGIGRIVATDTEGWQDRVSQITDGAPLRVGLDSVGGAASGDVLGQIAEGGTLVVFGAMASPKVELASGDIIFKQTTVRGFWGSQVFSAMSAEDSSRLFGELFARLEDGTITLTAEATYPLAQVAEAARHNGQAGRTGKVLLTP